MDTRKSGKDGWGGRGLLVGLLVATCLPAVAAERDARGDRAYPLRPEIGVFVAPETEHWRGNYVPDDYRLDDYDGRPGAGADCSGANGRTLSTTDAPCPAGQTRQDALRRWSTSP